MLDQKDREFLAGVSGGKPADEALWLAALTHGSTGEKRNYERLEFLGDRVLGLSVAEWLFENSEEAEGRLSQRLNALVSRQTCAQVARQIGLGPHMRLGKQARDDGGLDSDNILGDVMEALIGACFTERGFEAARDMVRALWAEPMQGKTGKRKHPKSALQEWAAGNRRRTPEYKLVERSGPDHASQFTVEVAVHNVGAARATANSKQDAETRAAEEFMRKFA
ncbi:ribonuclease III [Novosphingobium aerophilum]|uniref:ribonuclease III n=1 Tax=Novosphingobium TaxID=165696 RepID=UPI0006C882DF|nr:MULTISPECIES: ribonuclease III [unclassified Novosphingobium]KPH59361.1 ribonuclease III [Novosphingobium sp. ST904]MPS68953.1 ribonuclease III [Novosphingobium sp.]TCM40668.1 ribonuclease-3 [Novosphingobium sp. ST904]WRT92095.1 ribonuclease III [Novosphingobium sp. RL4]